jgi:hypothetical protein
VQRMGSKPNPYRPFRLAPSRPKILFWVPDRNIGMHFAPNPSPNLQSLVAQRAKHGSRKKFAVHDTSEMVQQRRENQMAFFRFHKSKSILPGVRVNLAKSGPSLSVGPKGATVNIGPRGVRTTVGLPGSGLSIINQKSWNSIANSETRAKKGKNRVDNIVDAAMDGMTKEQQREFAEKCVMDSPLASVMAQRDTFEAHIAEHAAEIEEGDKAEIEQMRKIYVDAIAIKRRESRR